VYRSGRHHRGVLEVAASQRSRQKWEWLREEAVQQQWTVEFFGCPAELVVYPVLLLRERLQQNMAADVWFDIETVVAMQEWSRLVFATRILHRLLAIWGPWECFLRVCFCCNGESHWTLVLGEGSPLVRSSIRLENCREHDHDLADLLFTTSRRTSLFADVAEQRRTVHLWMQTKFAELFHTVEWDNFRDVFRLLAWQLDRAVHLYQLHLPPSLVGGFMSGSEPSCVSCRHLLIFQRQQSASRLVLSWPCCSRPCLRSLVCDSHVNDCVGKGYRKCTRRWCRGQARRGPVRGFWPTTLARQRWRP